MGGRRARKGEVVNYEEPEWGPLLELVGERLVDTFMWMHEVELTNGVRVHAYKHIWTRDYLHLDAEGGAYDHVGQSSYRPLAPATALEAALELWWQRLGADLEDTVASWAAIERARQAA